MHARVRHTNMCMYNTDMRVHVGARTQQMHAHGHTHTRTHTLLYPRSDP